MENAGNLNNTFERPCCMGLFVISHQYESIVHLEFVNNSNCNVILCYFNSMYNQQVKTQTHVLKCY